MRKEQFSIFNYEATNTPVFEESQDHEWIKEGVDNLYPVYLQQLYVSSSIHNAIVNGVAQMIYGEGLDAVFKDFNIEQWLKVQQMFGDQECLKRCALDLKLYGQCFFNVIWSQDRASISEVHHIPASTIRCGVADDEDRVQTFYHKTDWSDTRVQPQAIPAFNTSDRTSASQIVHAKLYTPLSFYYGLPDYIGSQQYIEVDANLSEYHLNSISNGFFPSTILSFNDGVPTQEERAELERLVYNKFGGASNAGKILMTFNDSSENAPTVESFNISDAHQVFDYLSREVVIKILSGHRVTSPLLFGIRNEGGGFGSNADEMKDAYDLFYNTVILPFQRIILDALRPVLAASQITLDLYLKPLRPASFLTVDNLFGASQADTGDKDASYNGAQIASAVEVLVKVQEGILTEDQAKVFLVQMLQFTPEVAEALFVQGIDAIDEIAKEQEGEEAIAETQMSKKKKSEENVWLESLRNIDNRLDDKWQLVKSEIVTDTEIDHHLYNAKMKLFYQEYGDNYDQISPERDIISKDGYLFAVRYYYEETAETPPVNPNYKSRDFCEEMMDLSLDGVQYRWEDLLQMERDGVNSEFAPAGQSKYSIVDWKGGVYCRHGFVRNIYIYAPDGEVAEDVVELEILGAWEDVMEKVGNNFEVEQPGFEIVAPIDTPSRGSLKYG